MKQVMLLLKIMGILFVMTVSITPSYAFPPPPSNPTTMWMVVNNIPHPLAWQGQSWGLGLTNLNENYQNSFPGWIIDTIHWCTYGLDTYIAGNNPMAYQLNFNLASSATIQDIPIKVGAMVHNIADPSDAGWVTNFESNFSLDVLNTLRTSNSFTVIPWDLVKWVLNTNSGLDSNDPERFPISQGSLSGPALCGGIYPSQCTSTPPVFGNAVEIVGTIAPSIATSLGTWNMTQQYRLHEVFTGSVNSTYDIPWTPEQFDGIHYKFAWMNPPLNSKIFWQDMPGPFVSRLPLLGQSGDIIQCNMDFQDVASFNGNLASDTCFWHGNITLVWTTASWVPSFNAGTGNLISP